MLRIALRNISKVGVSRISARAPVRSVLPSVFASQQRLFCAPTETVIDVEPEKKVAPEAVPTTQFENYEFQAETRKLLDIVTHSIYTDKEVFIRELISNASDSLEKFRYQMATGQEITRPDDSPLEINVIVDADKKTITIQDNGIGMSKDDLVSHLGTIARSGSKQFVEKLSKSGASRDGDGIIGQFGVGFYSSFMVADDVTVSSLSATAEDGDTGHIWKSDGSGNFSIAGTQATRGSSITLHMKESCLDFCDPKRIKEIIKKYSNFVAFPVKVDGIEVNAVQAIWTKDKNSITETEYTDFYKYISNAFDKPKYTLHFSTDAPIDLKALVFFPMLHTEKFGMGRMEPGVNLYSRKVLIENKPADLLPSWLRFLKGVVDSEDLPLSIAREKAQDSLLLKKINDVLTRKVLRFLAERLKREPEAYDEWYKEFNAFIKEGLCMDPQYQDQLAKLLKFETSIGLEGDLITLDEYISRCPPEQKTIYYLIAPDRKSAFASPYYETFKKHNKEVLFMYNSIDDFVMSNLRNYSGKALKSAEDSSVKLDEEMSEEEKKKLQEERGEKEGDGETKDDSASKVTPLTEEETTQFCDWLKETLGSKVRAVKVTHRLESSPAIITDHESGAVRRMMKMVDQANLGASSNLPPQILHINPKHPIVTRLNTVKDSNPALAGMIAEQMLDNALVGAGLLDDVRGMVPRLNDILSKALERDA